MEHIPLPRRRIKIEEKNIEAFNTGFPSFAKEILGVESRKRSSDEFQPLPPQGTKPAPEENIMPLPPQGTKPASEENIMPLPPPPPPPPPKTIEIRLLSQGAYGCVFKPNITCEGSTGNNRYVSKIQNNDETIQNELNIDKRISSIDKFHMFFAPILESCPISLNSINNSEIKKCDVLSKAPAANLLDKYISTKIRYVSDKNIKSYLYQLPKIKEIIEQKLYTTYQYILHSLEKLSKNNVVHFDIKEKNIMYDERNHSPIIIDFGLSFDTSAPIIQEKVFYTDEFYLYWCIDIYIISYVVQKVRKKDIPKNVSSDILAILLDTYFKNMQDDINKYAIPMSDEEIRKIKERHYDFFKPYIGQPWETLVETLLKPEYLSEKRSSENGVLSFRKPILSNEVKDNYSTWDIYSSAITYMIICRKIDITQYDSQIINKLNALWKSIIIALPNERKSFAQIKEEMKQILLYGEKETDKPSQGTEEPAQGTEEPAQGTEEPAQGTEEPEKNNNWLPFMV